MYINRRIVSISSSDVEQGKVDKKAMLMYLSALYEVLGKLEPAVIETTSTVVSEEPVDEGIGKTTTSFEEVTFRRNVVLYSLITGISIYSIRRFNRARDNREFTHVGRQRDDNGYQHNEYYESLKRNE